jgi:putative endonuclease
LTAAARVLILERVSLPEPGRGERLAECFFYLARCRDGSLYAGACLDLAAREARHNSGRGARYTRSRRPVRMVYHERFASWSEALRREAEVKRWSKARKEALVCSFQAAPAAAGRQRGRGAAATRRGA